MRQLFKCMAAAVCALPLATMAATSTYSTDHTVTGSETAYTSSAGNANVTWQNFNFRAAVDKDHLAHGYYFYLKDGDTDIGETEAAVKLDSITLMWGSNGGGDIGTSDTPYLVVTTADNTPVIIGVSAAGEAFAANGTSTFAFSDVVLASNAKYRFYFYKNDVSGLTVGATLSGAVTGRVNGRWHNTSGDRRADYNDICCNGGNGYSVNCSFVVSPLEEGDATVLETSSTSVSVGNVSTPVVIEGTVADGVVEVGSSATVSGVFTVCGEATTLELTDSLTATAFYFPAAVTIDASSLSGLDPTGVDSSKTTTLLSGALKYTTTPTVVLPAATAGMIYETNITSSGISVTVVKGVDCVETITADTSWSTIKPSGWVDSLVGDKPAITITYAGEDPVTLTFDETVQAGSLTLTGNIVVEASAAATFGTVIAGAGSVVEMANLTITTQSGSGVYRYRTDYPSTVPNNSLTYEYVGTADPETPGTVNLNNMRGTVRTTGYMSITGYYPLLTNAKLDVVSGTTTLTAGGQAICGYITIREGATLVNTATDSLAYSSYNSIIDIYGTLDMGTSRWTVWSGATFNLRGGEITGVGEGNNGAIDLMGTCNIIAYADSTISANVKFRNALSNVTVDNGVTLTISGETKPGYDGGGITKKGAGTLKFTSDPYVPGGITVEAGTLAFDTASDVDPVVTYAASVLNSANMDYVSASNWKGRVVVSAVAAGTTATQVALNKTGNENSYLTLNGISGDAWCAGSDYTVQPAITLAGDVNFQNGSSKKAVTFRKIAAGTGNLSLKSWSGCTGITYGFTTLDADNYTGTIQLDGSVLTFNVGDILKAGAAVGDKVLPLTVTNSAAVNFNSATLNGKAAGFELREDGVYYTTAYVTVTVPAVDNATVTVKIGDETIGTTAGDYDVASNSVVTVTYAAEPGYAISGTLEYTIDTSNSETTFDPAGATQVAAAVAYVVFQEESGQSFVDVTNYYATVAAAIDAAKALKKTIVLVAQPDVDDTYEINVGETINVQKGEFTFDGIIFPEGSQYINTTTETAGVTQYKCAVYTATVQYPGQEPESVSGQLMQILGGLYSSYAPSLVGTVVTVLDGSDATVGDAMPDVFTYNSEAHTYTLKAMVASINTGAVDIYYPTISNAFEAVVSGQTIKVLCDNTSNVRSVRVKEGATVTLDLNGCTVTGPSEDNPMFWLENNSNFVVTDTTEDRAGKLVSEASKVVWSNNRCTFTLTAGTIESTADVPIYIYFGGVNGSRIVNINGGKLVSSTSSSSNGDFCIMNANGIVNMTAGEIVSSCGGIRGSESSISGGTITVNRGVFYNTENQRVTGGTFNKDVSEYVPSGYEVVNNGNGTYTVRPDMGWIYSAPGAWEYTGTWEGATLGDEKVTIETNATYTASAPSANDLVTLNMTLCFDDVNDDDIDLSDVKGAVRLGKDGDNYVFQLATTGTVNEVASSVWANASCDTAALPETDYKFLFVLNLSTKTYTASVIVGTTTNALSVAGSTTIAFANYNKGEASPVQELAFIGSGSVSSLTGSYEDAPLPPEFVKDEEVTLKGGSKTLTAGEAAWLNACGNKATVGEKIGNLTPAEFNRAYLLNLDVCDDNYSDVEKPLSVTAISVGDTTVTVTVTVTRNGAFANEGINGTLKLKGAAALDSSFEVISTAEFEDDDFSESDTTSTTFNKGEDPAKFYKAVIE